MEIDENDLGINKIWYRCGSTLDVEYSQYQGEPTPVCFAWMEPWDSSLYLSGQEEASTQRVFLTVIDETIDGILEEIKLASSNSVADLLQLHYNGWEDIWSTGNIQVEGDFDLAHTLLASQYYLYSSLPFPSLENYPVFVD